MNWGYEFSKRALREFREIDVWLGEEVLDEMESVLANPPERRHKGPAGFVHDFKRRRDDQSFYVFLTILPISRRQVFRITSIGIHARRE